MSDLYGEREQQSYEGIWPSLNKFLLVLILFTLSIPIAYSFIPAVKLRQVEAAKIEELTAQIDDARMKLAHLQRQAFLLANDHEYIALVARDRLDLMDKGETIFRMDSAKSTVAPKTPLTR